MPLSLVCGPNSDKVPDKVEAHERKACGRILLLMFSVVLQLDRVQARVAWVGHVADGAVGTLGGLAGLLDPLTGPRSSVPPGLPFSVQEPEFANIPPALHFMLVIPRA